MWQVERGKESERSKNSDDRSTIKLQRSSIFMIQYEFEMKQMQRGKRRAKHNYTHHTLCTVAVYRKTHRANLYCTTDCIETQVKQNKMCKFATLFFALVHRLNMSTDDVLHIAAMTHNYLSMP